MIARVVAVNLGLPRSLGQGKERVLTAIHKRAVDTVVHMSRLGLEGDTQCDRDAHGGPDKAVYALGVEEYAYWRQTLGRPGLALGEMGENLSIEGVDEDAVRIGDRFAVGERAIVEVSEPRIPCRVLAMQIGDPAFVKRFAAHAGSGFYLRVVEEGPVRVGDALRRVLTDAARPTVRQDFRARVAKHV